MFVQMICFELLKLLLPNLVWRCIIMGQVVFLHRDKLAFYFLLSFLFFPSSPSSFLMKFHPVSVSFFLALFSFSLSFTHSVCVCVCVCVCVVYTCVCVCVNVVCVCVCVCVCACVCSLCSIFLHLPLPPLPNPPTVSKDTSLSKNTM